ncbi:MAG TPA: Gfo/Idh/MocA family oxidoreductase [Xanthobacteraceae bacterium]|nr:Gfo/Idh/MocA family oxidoreductase [Xanthobacteraceae bacterium]
MTLRAMVLGAGSAGEGHALALRQAGADVVAIASRTAEVVRRVADDLGIPLATTEWRTALADLRPDIVAIATPGDSHAEMIEAALAQQCHIYIDKPVAVTAAAARPLARAARAAGVKTAYAATSNYQPAALLARALVAEGAIGELLEAEFVSHYHWPRMAPFGWPHRLATGGGRLNNNFTHKAAIAEAIAGGVMLAVAGETRNDLKRAPLAPMPHDFRDWQRAAPSAEQAAGGDWAEVDSDWSYTVLARIGAPGSDPADGMSATFRHSCLRQGKHQDYVAFYGSRGTIHVDKAYCQGALHLWKEGDASFREVPVPAEILTWLPPVERRANWAAGWEVPQRAWNALARDFVADIEGRGHQPYLTIEDGWRHQEAIDAVRAAAGWAKLSAEP